MCYELADEHPFLRELVERYHLRPPEHRYRRDLIDSPVFRAIEWGVFDFTDMLYIPVACQLPLAARYAVVASDEAQVLSRLQPEAVLRLKKRGGWLIFVRDARQAIYGFAGADVESLSRIVRRTRARRLPLSLMYRCPNSHVRTARAIAPEVEAAPRVKAGSLHYINRR